MISACAELTKRLVSGQGLASEDDKGSVSKWITFTPKPEAKGDPRLINTLVVVGCVTLCQGPSGTELTILQYILHWEGADCERSAPRKYIHTYTDKNFQLLRKRCTRKSTAIRGKLRSFVVN